MQIYNNKAWAKALFMMSRADTARKLSPLITGVFLYSLLVAFAELDVLKIHPDSWVRNVPTLHTLLGFAISILLVFRTNTAYDRWWEGRKLWGALVNNSRNLALKIRAMVPDTDTQLFFARAIPLYADSLQAHLQLEQTRLALDDQAHPEWDAIDTEKHIPNQIAGVMIRKITELYKNGVITGDQLIVLNGELSSFTDICGAYERIKNTPIPQSYSAFIKKFIFLYISTLPMGYVFTLGYFVAPVVAIVFYVLGSLELVAEEIEDPFGNDDNDLPMTKIASNIRKHVGEILPG
ncbi:MAG: bestrophin family ion channel [Rubrivivax sp.]